MQGRRSCPKPSWHFYSQQASVSHPIPARRQPHNDGRIVRSRSLSKNSPLCFRTRCCALRGYFVFSEKDLASCQRRSALVRRLSDFARARGLPIFVSQEQIANCFNVDRATVYRWRKQFSDFPQGIRVGRTLRFNLQEVEAWWLQHQEKGCGQ